MKRWNGLRLVAVILTTLLFTAGSPAAPAVPQPFNPDPATVQRCGPGYRFPQHGWIVVHIEGAPYERGYQYGQLLAPEIAGYLKVLANAESAKAPADGLKHLRRLANALFLRRYDREYLEEMKGIADGAAANGAKFENRKLDLLDVVVINASVEVDFLDAALEATPTGLEGERFQPPPFSTPKVKQEGHCSAFAATGPATADGQIVFGHITMWGLYHARFFNVWLDVQPKDGHRVLMQTYPGGIMSGMDYYVNDAGLIVAETTINQTHFDVNGWSLVARCRKALQYADSIDKAVECLGKDNNGLYSNEWLLADTKTNEIAMFELGTHKSKLWRSSKHEWVAGTEGFYWGCNNAKDLEVRLETVAGVNGKPINVIARPSSRDLAWLKLYDQHKGKIGTDFAFAAFTNPSLCFINSSLDAKFTTTALAKNLQTVAMFGPPCGPAAWQPSPLEKLQHPDITPLERHEWTLLDGRRPEGAVADQAPAGADQPAGGERVGPAWRGTLLPKTGGDVWLAAAFAEYERIVARELALRAKAKDGELTKATRDTIEGLRTGYRNRYLAAVKRLGKEIPLAQIEVDWRGTEWYDQAVGKGVLLLAELRETMGPAKFDAFMDAFGTAHAGQPVTTAEFRLAAEKAHGGPLGGLFDPWLTTPMAEKFRQVGQAGR